MPFADLQLLVDLELFDADSLDDFEIKYATAHVGFVPVGLFVGFEVTKGFGFIVNVGFIVSVGFGESVGSIASVENVGAGVLPLGVGGIDVSVLSPEDGADVLPLGFVVGVLSPGFGFGDWGFAIFAGASVGGALERSSGGIVGLP